MREEMLVLGGSQRIDENLGQIAVFDQAAFFTRLIVKIRHQFGWQPRSELSPTPGFMIFDQRVFVNSRRIVSPDFGFDDDPVAADFV